MSALTNTIEAIKNIIPGLSASSPASDATEAHESNLSETETPQLHPDESPIDPEASKAKLERALHDRPEQKDLVERNILKSDKLAPSLHAAQAELKRAQIEDTLEHALQEKIRRQSEAEHILGSVTPPVRLDESHIDTEASKARLERSLQERPAPKDLVDKNILKSSNAAPALQAAQAELGRAQLGDQLEHALQQRPKPEELVREGILYSDEAPPA